MPELAVCAIFKNEAPYLKDWLRFHRNAGVQHFFLYNNNSTDNWKDKIRNFPVSIIEWKQHPGQMPAYQNSLSLLKSFKWVAYLDIDEYLFPLKALTIPEALKKYDRPRVSQVCAFWNVFNSAGQKEYEDKPVFERFTKRIVKYQPHVKTIIRPMRVTTPFTPHMFHSKRGFVAVDEDFKEVREPTPPSTKSRVFSVNHYYTKSLEEWKLKVARGRSDTGTFRNVKEFNKLEKSKTIDDFRILDYWKKIEK